MRRTVVPNGDSEPGRVDAERVETGEEIEHSGLGSQIPLKPNPAAEYIPAGFAFSSPGAFSQVELPVNEAI
jgi:hypothetical protein